MGVALGALVALSMPALAEDSNRLDVNTNDVANMQEGNVVAAGSFGLAGVIPVLQSGNTVVSSVSINGIGTVSANSGNNALIQQQIGIGVNFGSR